MNGENDISIINNDENYILEDIQPLENDFVDIAVPFNENVSSELDDFQTNNQFDMSNQNENTGLDNVNISNVSLVDNSIKTDASIEDFSNNDISNISLADNSIKTDASIEDFSNDNISNISLADNSIKTDASIEDFSNNDNGSIVPSENINIDSDSMFSTIDNSDSYDITGRDDYKEVVNERDTRRQNIEDDYFQKQNEIISDNNKIMNDINDKYNQERSNAMNDFNNQMGQGALDDEQIRIIEENHNSKMEEIERRYNDEYNELSQNTEKQLNDLRDQYNKDIYENDTYAENKFREIEEKVRQEQLSTPISDDINESVLPSDETDLRVIPEENSIIDNELGEVNQEPISNESESNPISENDFGDRDKPNNDWGIEHSPSGGSSGGVEQQIVKDDSSAQENINNNKEIVSSKSDLELILDPKQLNNEENNMFTVSGSCSGANNNMFTVSGSCSAANNKENSQVENILKGSSAGGSRNTNNSDISGGSSSCGSTNSKENSQGKEPLKGSSSGWTEDFKLSSSLSGSSTFSYFMEDDMIEYDVDAAEPIIEDLKSDLIDAGKKLATLVIHLVELQANCHDKENTNLTEDYNDFAALIGDRSEGIIGYLLDACDLTVEISQAVNEFKRITSKN